MVSMSHGSARSAPGSRTISTLVSGIFECTRTSALARIGDILFFSPPGLAQAHYEFAREATKGLGLSLSAKQGGPIQGVDGKPTEVLGFHYTARSDGATGEA